MEKEDYVSLWNIINNYWKGDPLMKIITAILKVPGVYDLKNKRNFKIQKLYDEKRNIIGEESVSILLKKKITYDLKRKEHFEIKEAKKKRNKKLVDSIDAIDFIESINEYFFNYPIHLGEGSVNKFIDDSDGLTVYLKRNGKSEIKDHSYTKGGKLLRAGNYNFLFNYFWRKHKEKISIIKIMFFLQKRYNIHLNASVNKVPIISEEIRFDSKKLMSLNQKIYSLAEAGYMEKVLRNIFYFGQKVNETGEGLKIKVTRSEFIKNM
jgi:hypothetical protein